MKVTFPISIGGGDLDITIDVSNEEWDLIKKYANDEEECYDFLEEVEALSDLNRRVMDAVKENVIENADEDLYEIIGVSGDEDDDTIWRAVQDHYNIGACFPENATE